MQRIDQLGGGRAPVLRCPEMREVAAGDEGAPFRGNDDDSQGFVRRHAFDDGGKRLRHFQVEHVEPVGTIESYLRYAAVAGIDHRLIAGLHSSSSPVMSTPDLPSCR